MRFEVEGTFADLVICNCSICIRSAYIHWEVSPDRFRLLTSPDAIDTYEFGTRTAKHHFCRVCGVSSFRRSRTSPGQIDVNVRCLEGVDLATLEVEPFDGRDWERAAAHRRRTGSPQAGGRSRSE